MGKEKKCDCHKKEFKKDEMSKEIKCRIKEKNEKYNVEVPKIDINSLITEIDDYLSQIKKEEQEVDLDLEQITKEVNEKLAVIDDAQDDELEQTLYDLSEISKMIKNTIDRLEKDKEKKRKKAMYCDQARRNKANNKKNKTSKKVK